MYTDIGFISDKLGQLKGNYPCRAMPKCTFSEDLMQVGDL